MYKTTILDVKDIEIMAYIADKITDGDFVRINDALDSYDSAVAETYWKVGNDNKK